MSFSIVNPYRLEDEVDFLGGPNGDTESLILTDGGKLQLSEGNDDEILQSNGDILLMSPYTCEANILISPSTTDKLLISGGTDELLLSGYCTSSLLLGGDFIIRSEQ